MGQIIGGAAKPKRCNLNKLSQLGTPAAGEYILVSSDNSMNAAGQGDFDAYVKGDGVKPATELELKSLVDDGAFDISAYRATGNVLAKYVDLSAALDGGNNIPEAFRKGGISVKFVQSSDNKYVQYRLMSDTFNTTPANWQGVDDELSGSKNLPESGAVLNYTRKNFPHSIENNSDLDFCDKKGYVIAQFNEGHVQTKNFDSRNTDKAVEYKDGDLVFVDINRNCILKIENGYPITKKFFHQLYKKRISIIGDSISTFAYTTSGDYSGCSVVHENYFQSADTDVHYPEDTWFGQLAAKSGAILNRIASYGGGDVTTKLKDYYNKVYSNGTSGTSPNVIFIFAGINDFGHGCALGTLEDYYNEITDTFYGAYEYLLDKLQETFPSAMIICMTPIYSAYRGTGIPYEVKNSIGLTIRDYDDAIINICKQMGVKCIDIYPNCGINRHNYSQLMFDYTHPNKNGLSKIADVVFNELK